MSNDTEAFSHLEDFDSLFQAGNNEIESIRISREFLIEFLTTSEEKLKELGLPVPADGLFPKIAFVQDEASSHPFHVVIGRQDPGYPGLWIVVPPGHWAWDKEQAG